MKLRVHGNSVRLRLTRGEVERLRDTGRVEGVVDFGGGETLTYRLVSRTEPGPVRAGFRKGVVTASISAEEAQAWTSSDEVGIYGRSGAVMVSIEKDFRCLIRPLDQQEQDAYPHPGQSPEARSQKES